MKNQKWIKRIALSMAGIIVFLGAMLILTHTAQNSIASAEILPTIDPDPVYVVCEDGEPLTITLKAAQDFSISGFQLLLVNISEKDSGTLRLTLKNEEEDVLLNESCPVTDFTAGKWGTFPGNASFIEGESYQLTIRAEGAEPYFMQVPEGWGRELPFEEAVWQDQEVLPYGISLGILQTEQTHVTYGDIFYYSVPVCILLLIAWLSLVWIGREQICAAFQKIPFEKWIDSYGSDCFLLLLFAAICISIYARAYLNGIYISADSAGYMREAENLVQGNGFQYDGIAGYRSWFANWPILYPVMIAGIMLITGANAYLASKIVAMVTVFLLLVVLRLCFKREAWLYALCLTNTGFLTLCYYTWSEIPFILFMLCFGLILARILQDEKTNAKWYVLLGAMGLSCFLTRYYGIYVWIVTGVYILILFFLFQRKKDKAYLIRAGKLTLTALVSGLLSVAYLAMNKIMNGMASGVSRTMWWDDYQALTNDLIESLLTEFFNIFSLAIPERLENYPYNLKVFLIVLILAGLAAFIFRSCRHFTRESVLITMGILYDVIFIGIRYVSSMDSFYFRFFEPGTFLICIGLAGLLLPYVKGRKPFRFFGMAVTVITVLSVLSLQANGELDASDCYYNAVARQWEEAYAEIPERSVVIFDDIDYRSTWYRADVVDGMITPQDTLESLKETYYGSDYLCVRKTFAETMLESGEYEEHVSDWLAEGLQKSEDDREYVVLALKD